MNAQEKKMLFYESFADEFDSKMNMYDTNKRLSVVFDELLKNENLEGKKLLDAGCGTGWFSKAACERKANVVSMDVGDKLLSKVASKCNSDRVVGSILNIPFPNQTFDVVISSEVIEHIPEPFSAIREMHRVLKKDGILVLTTPNKLWYFSVLIANRLKLRPYQGLENWISRNSLQKNLVNTGFKIEKIKGIHLLPFVHPYLYPVLDFFHSYNETFLGRLMVNMAVRGRKK